MDIFGGTLNCVSVNHESDSDQHSNFVKMRDLDANNPFTLASQRAYTLTTYRRSDHKSMCGRVLGYMLKELPWDSARLKMATEVNSCVDDQQLVDLGHFYINHFLRARELQY